MEENEFVARFRTSFRRDDQSFELAVLPKGVEHSSDLVDVTWRGNEFSSEEIRLGQHVSPPVPTVETLSRIEAMLGTPVTIVLRMLFGGKFGPDLLRGNVKVPRVWGWAFKDPSSDPAMMGSIGLWVPELDDVYVEIDSSSLLLTSVRREWNSGEHPEINSFGDILSARLNRSNNIVRVSGGTREEWLLNYPGLQLNKLSLDIEPV